MIHFQMDKIFYKDAICNTSTDIQNLKTQYENATNSELSYAGTRSFAVAKVKKPENCVLDAYEYKLACVNRGKNFDSKHSK